MHPKIDFKSKFLILVTFIYEVTGNGIYGLDWMYFPDGDGIPRCINLSSSEFHKDLPSFSQRTKRDVEFRLYTKKTLGNYIVLNNLMPKGDSEGIFETLPRAPLKVITHGWMSSADKDSVMNLVDAYLQAENEANIIAVDWSSYSMNYFYMTVANETKEVGRIVAQFLDFLHTKYHVFGNQIHLIGHSLGAHIMGIAGFESKMKIGRITGLDPALPMFKNVQEKKSRLDYDDATFVDVIHTCGGVLGFLDAIGKADFYPNNGMAPQPGCQGFNIIQFEACSHGRSIDYFSESILDPEAFPSYECKGWKDDIKENCRLAGYMGEYVDLNMSGVFYLQTNSETPFGNVNTWLEH